MARKPNYGFERREREKAKAEKKAERLAARQAGKALEDGDPDSEAPEGEAAPSEDSAT